MSFYYYLENLLSEFEWEKTVNFDTIVTVI